MNTVLINSTVINFFFIICAYMFAWIMLLISTFNIASKIFSLAYVVVNIVNLIGPRIT